MVCATEKDILGGRKMLEKKEKKEEKENGKEKMVSCDGNCSVCLARVYSKLPGEKRWRFLDGKNFTYGGLPVSARGD